MSERARSRSAYWLAGAAVCAGGVVVCAVIAPQAAAAAWLVGFLFWSEVAVGSLLLMMIHRLTGGRWGVALQPSLRVAALTIPLMLVLIIPLLIAVPTLYPWSHAVAGVKPDVLARYLNVPFFVARSLIVLAVWSALAVALPRFAGPRGQLIAALGLVFYCVVIGPIGFDWVLSLAPPFASSSFGASIAVAQLIAALAFALVVAPPSANDPVIGDLGGLLLAFLLGLAYIDFMAALVIWYGDVPQTNTWFVTRSLPPWSTLAVAAFGLGSLAPIAALFSPRVRHDPALLRGVAICALLGLVVYDAYLVVPPFGALALVPAALAVAASALLLVALTSHRIASTQPRPAYGD